MRFAHRERPSDRERLQHFNERQARDNTRPHGQGITALPTTSRGARVQPDAARTQREETSMSRTEWYDDPQTVWDVANWANTEGEFVRPEEVLAFFEKPHHWPQFHEGWSCWMRTESESDRAVSNLLDRSAA